MSAVQVMQRLCWVWRRTYRRPRVSRRASYSCWVWNSTNDCSSGEIRELSTASDATLNCVSVPASAPGAKSSRTRRLSLRKPHSGTSSSISCSPIPSPITSSSSDSPLCTSITPSLFHSQLKTYPFHKSYLPLVSLLPPGLPPRTFACTVSSELYSVFYFDFFIIFRFWAVR